MKRIYNWNKNVPSCLNGEIRLRRNHVLMFDTRIDNLEELQKLKYFLNYWIEEGESPEYENLEEFWGLYPDVTMRDAHRNEILCYFITKGGGGDTRLVIEELKTGYTMAEIDIEGIEELRKFINRWIPG